MLEKLADTITKITDFTNQHSIAAEFHLHSVSELRNPSDRQADCWRRFEKHPGVYCIFDSTGQAVRYVGMSMCDTGTRLFQWLFPGGRRGPVETSMFVDDDIVLSIVLPKQHYMAPALESFLIDALKPSNNKRR
ncbi:MAG: hypothetical protein IT430_19655 [Phycisphaerales bacterium]|nr:hypothetical protein [Phycisphaerales bacterium]